MGRSCVFTLGPSKSDGDMVVYLPSIRVRVMGRSCVFTLGLSAGDGDIVVY